MNIIELAKEAGAMFDHMTWVERDLAPVFERFAALVRAEVLAEQLHPERNWPSGGEAKPVKQEPVACPNLQPVINWLENGCDPKEAVKELRIYQNQMKAAPVDAKAIRAEALEEAAKVCDEIENASQGNIDMGYAFECAAAIRGLK